MARVPDPYRELGVLRGATDAQIKAAHRRLAKRFHPDAAEGDHARFLAVQEAYLLLSDPLRRREWDAGHSTGPVRAADPGPRPGSTGAAHAAGQRPRPPGPSRGEDRRQRSRAWSTRDRDPGTRSSTWSAAGVPWWEDFTPRDGAEADDTAGAAEPRAGVRRGTRDQDEMGVYDRSSGAAWSMAARRYFRRGEQELPRGGVFRYRGTQVVSGAESRRVAAEDEARRRAAEQQPRDPAPTDPAPTDPAPGLRGLLIRLLGRSAARR